MDGLVILVEFRLKPGTRDRFLAEVEPDARDSVAKEPGCRRFDVLVPEDEADVVWLYEIYDDAAAFDAHMETPHLKEFRAAIEPIVERSTIRRCALHEHAKR
jgi:quinol monooxygenase YgiN